MSYDLTVKDAYRRMAYIRAFEEQVLELGYERFGPVPFLVKRIHRVEPASAGARAF